jgi:hypothetical protein
VRRLVPLLASVALGACKVAGDDARDTDVPAGWVADPRADVIDCPNAPGCEPSEDRALKAAVAVGSITPACFETWVDQNGDHLYQPSFGDTHRDEFLDCGCDRLCPEDDGYEGPDEGEGDGVFHAVWMAGFDNARPALGVRPSDLGFLADDGDGLEARVVVLEQGHSRLALVSLDAMGVMYDDVQRIRKAVKEAGVDVDHVLVTSSHTHSGPDTMGIWGPTVTSTGYDAGYASQIADTVADLVGQAVAGLEPVSMKVGQIDANTVFENGIDNLISDLRDPQIADPRVGAIQLLKGDGSTLSTIVHFANHPETIADENNWLTADFIHGLRRAVSEGVRYQDGTAGHAGVGGTTIYVQGTVGGMMTSLHASVTDPTGAVFRDHSWDKVDTVGALVGELALRALDDAPVVTDPGLRFVGRQIFLPVDNVGFQAMFTLGLFAHRPAYHYDETQPISDENHADVQTEIDLVQLGPVRLLSLPGEILPEVVIGGYDGKYTAPGGQLIKDDNPNPPDLSKAPAGPYLLDDLGGDPSWIVGLGNDELGYVVPPYNFELAAAAYLDEAEGDHYEETNSLGPQSAPLLEQYSREILAYFDGD